MLMYEKVLDEKLRIPHRQQRFQLLAPMKKGLLGVDNLNIVLPAADPEKCHGVDVEDVPAGRRPGLFHDK